MATVVCSGDVTAVRWGKHKREPDRRHQAA
jgi:hypothetical protein